jgi:hypothetical protein
MLSDLSSFEPPEHLESFFLRTALCLLQALLQIFGSFADLQHQLSSNLDYFLVPSPSILLNLISDWYNARKSDDPFDRIVVNDLKQFHLANNAIAFPHLKIMVVPSNKLCVTG